MCYRYSFAQPIANVQRIANAKALDFIDWQPKIDAQSGDFMPVITNEFPGIIQYFKWGLVPVWAKNIVMGNNMIHTKMENLVEKPALQAIFRYKRCLVPATSFSIWLSKEKTAQKDCTAPLDQFFFMAGLWDVWGEGLQSFSIITQQKTNYPGIYVPYIISINEKEKWLSKYPANLQLFETLHPINTII